MSEGANVGTGVLLLSLPPHITEQQVKLELDFVDFQVSVCIANGAFLSSPTGVLIYVTALVKKNKNNNNSGKAVPFIRQAKTHPLHYAHLDSTGFDLVLPPELP